MKKILITIAYAAAVITASSCAKKIETSPNEANNRFLEAWMQVTQLVYHIFYRSSSITADPDSA